ncbi:MAG: PQQ-binding-like beta-propeller repeat protein [Verrucomicrobiales bacterium]|nr:PQQ-binding-like beta-propeller repeat protein [Verrucomicrobiales bacterium]
MSATPASLPPVATKPAQPGSKPQVNQPIRSEAQAAARGWLRVATILAVFLIGVAAVMVWGQWIQPREEPWRSKRLTEARERLAAEPRNEALKSEIRELDRQLRLSYFRSLERNRWGAGLLLAAGVGLVLVSRLATFNVRRLDALAPAPIDDRVRRIRSARIVVLATGGALVALFGAMGWQARSPLEVAEKPASTGSTQNLPPTVPAWPSAEELARQWPRFRGFDGSGTARSSHMALTWDAKTGAGIAWKTAIELEGYNSPVVWSNRVFLTGGDKKARLVYSFDLGSGAVVWQRPLAPTNAASPAIEPPSQSGQAASTVATDGRRVYAVFATGELGALDFDGHLVWNKRLDFSENGYGHASSLVVWHDKLLVQQDQGQADDGKSKIEAFDTATGKALWSVKRPVGGSWTTPIIIEGDSRNLVVAGGDPWLIAHDLADGAEVWRASVLGGELAPSPIFAGDRIIATSPGHAMTALKFDGAGDVTKSHVVWRFEDAVPDVPTPVVTGDLLFTANTEGHLICRELATGKQLWKHELEAEIQASPLVAGDRLYLFTQPGGGFVIQVGREYRQLSTFEMGDEVYASPAVAGDRLLVRTKKALVCVEPEPGERQVADAR